jgi:hypothetical protein
MRRPRAFTVLTAAILAGACRTGAPRPATCAPPEPPATSRWTLAVGTTGLEARLLDPSRLQPLRGTLRLEPLDGGNPLGRLTDSTGLAVFDTLPAGRYIAHAFAIGFVVRTDTLVLVSGRRWIGEVRLPQHRIRLNDECGMPGAGP